MRITFLGHASLLVETADTVVLMDPVLADPFEEGTVVSCPEQVIDPDRMPVPDIVVVSHRHPDHFDIPSLARLPRSCDAICPPDPVIVHALKRLGFAGVHPVHAMAPILGNGFELFPTAAALAGIPEFGVVVRDASGTAWNQADSLLTPATIQAVRPRFGPPDVHVAMYASQNFDFFANRTTAFPAKAHAANLQHVLDVGGRLVVPGAAGFRFSSDVFDFTTRPPTVLDGPSAVVAHADVVHRIAAGILIAWSEHRRSFFSVRAWSRRFSTLCEVTEEDGAVAVRPVPVPDLLIHWMPAAAPGSATLALQELDRQVDALA